jgi:cell shape-determining protein MreC
MASVVITPVNVAKHWVSDSGGSLPQFIRNRSELIDEMNSLRSELAASSGDRFTTKGLLKENKELRSLLGDEAESRILAGVVARPVALPYDSLMIDKGTRQGVHEGAPVFIGDNTVIGIVKNATFDTSLVELATTDGFSTTVYIVGPDIYTNAVGIGGGQMRVGVPQGISLSEGDLVMFPSVASGIYGAISVVQSEPSRPEQYGYVSPDIPLSSIRFVSVGTRPLQKISFEEAQEILEKNKENIFTVPVPEDILVDTSATTSTSSDENLENYEE